MKLLQPTTLAGMPLRNRLAVAPMSRMQAHDDGTVTPDMPAYYARYAAEGAGLVFTEAIYADPTSGRAYFRQPGLCDDRQAESWRPVVQAVHAEGVPLFAQLQHGGRLAEPGLNALHLAASDGTAAGLTWQTGSANKPARTATAEQITSIVQTFADAARRACDIGFDGVEIHGARGYLLDDFLSASTNRRQDEYGASLEGRLRLPVEVVRQVRSAIGSRPLSYNLSLYKMDDVSYQPPGGEEEIAAIVRTLESAGVDIFQITTRRALRAEPWGKTLVRTVADHVTRAVVIANGGLTTMEQCEEALDQQQAGIVSLARAMLANPDWLRRVLNGEELRKYSAGLERLPLLLG